MSQSWGDILRDAIRDSGKSALGLSKECGVSQPTITEFLGGKDIRLTTAEKIATILGLELREKRKRRK